ncbi:MAG TPA: hypothetical protein DCL99_04655, partial [Firmicutes bacterium]|nr:hypothetical protein [Bacillota bacterium]
PWIGHQRLQKRTGETVEVDLAVSPVRDEKGLIAHHVILASDVTREAALVQQVIQSQKLEAIGTLAGGIAHDLKNILSPIVLNAFLISLYLRLILEVPSYWLLVLSIGFGQSVVVLGLGIPLLRFIQRHQDRFL